MASFYTVEEAQDEWADWPREEDDGTDLLSSILAAAKEAVLAYVPVITNTTTAPVTLTAPDWTVALSGVDGLVLAVLTVDTIAGASSESVAVPAPFRPLGAPAYVPTGGQAQGRFTNDDNANMLLTANPPGGQTFSMTWQAADTAAWVEDIPDGWRIAQLLQARNIWNSGKATPSGDFDGGQYSLTTFPLDWQVRQLIRPKRGRPVIA